MSFEFSRKLLNNCEDIEDFGSDSDILDLDHIHFDDNETWLYNPREYSHNSTVVKTEKYQHGIKEKDSNSKNINTQTFTRPKKKLQRVSIEKYNEELFGMDNIQESPPSFHSKTLTKDQTPTKPLDFDLSQSTNNYYFEKLANSSIDDTFLNMSPPSLVNSMCSSTFTNLMESSVIKNDPVLKQICDTDFTASILSQCSEPSSLVQSINYTTTIDDLFLSSNQCDMMLRSIEINNIDLKCSGDATYIDRKDNNINDNSSKMDFEEFHDASDATFEKKTHQKTPVHDGTYRKSKLSSATFRKTDLNNRTLIRNFTYEIDPKDIEEAQNVTLLADQQSKSVLNTSNSTTIVKDSCNNDLGENEIAAVVVDNVNVSKNSSGKSLDCSIGSADSLDRMSTLSSSSKGSGKEADGIADKQEKQPVIMSTPKPNWTSKVLNRVMWDYDHGNGGYISPIPCSSQSDSGESSDDYKSVKSSFSKNSLENNAVKQTRSLVSLQPPDVRKLKSINTIANQGNLKVPAKYTLPKNGSKLAPMKSGSAGSIHSNLNTMRPTLKGSYTSLKPVNSQLPVAPPIVAQTQALDSTFLRPSNAPSTDTKKGDTVFVKPSGLPLKSCLPRPTSSTSIPRPVSKIPGPRRY